MTLDFAKTNVDQEDRVIERVETLLDAIERAGGELTPELETGIRRLADDHERDPIRQPVQRII